MIEWNEKREDKQFGRETFAQVQPCVDSYRPQKGREETGAHPQTFALSQQRAFVMDIYSLIDEVTGIASSLSMDWEKTTDVFRLRYPYMETEYLIHVINLARLKLDTP